MDKEKLVGNITFKYTCTIIVNGIEKMYEIRYKRDTGCGCYLKFKEEGYSLFFYLCNPNAYFLWTLSTLFFCKNIKYLLIMHWLTRHNVV